MTTDTDPRSRWRALLADGPAAAPQTAPLPRCPYCRKYLRLRDPATHRCGRRYGYPRTRVPDPTRTDTFAAILQLEAVTGRPSIRAAQKILGCSRRQAEDAVHALRDLGLIRCAQWYGISVVR